MTGRSIPAHGGVTDDPIEIGTLLFTLVEPHRGHELAYNRWYERDHFYAGCQIGAYDFAGARFVATADLKGLRLPRGEPGQPAPLVVDPEVGSYLALYYVLAGHHDEWNRWAVDQVNALHAAGRMFEERDHVHTGLYAYRWECRRDGEDGVPAALTLDHRFAGLVSVFVETAEGTGPDGVASACRSVLARTIAGTPVATVLAFTPLPLLSDAPGDVPRDAAGGRRLLLLCFLDDEPAASWDAVFAPLPSALSGAGVGEVVWASPFVATVPGTDRYTDQLWRSDR